MGYYGVNLLRITVEFDGLSTLLLSNGVGFFLFLWPLRGVLLGLLLEYFSLFLKVPGAMHQAFFSLVSLLLG